MSMRRIIGLALLMLLTLGSGSPLVRGQGSNDDKLVLSGEYVLGSGETLAGDLTILGGRAVLEQGSIVEQDVVLFGGELLVAGTVHGGVTVFGGTIMLGEAAVIEGDFAVFGGTVNRDPGATVQGDVFGRPRVFPELPIPPLRVRLAETAEISPLGALLRWQMGAFGLGLLLAVVAATLVLLLPQHVGLVMANAAQQPAYCFGIGLLTLVLAVLVGGLLLIACGLGLLIWLGLFGGLLMGWSAAGTWLGQRLLATLRVGASSVLVDAALGVFVLTILARLPLGLGLLVVLVVGSMGLGAVVVTRFGTRPSQPYANPHLT